MRDELYQKHILDHATRPRNKGVLAGATHHGAGKNPSCGDALTMHLRVHDDGIEEVSFEGVGCALSQAAASILTERVRKLTLSEVRALTDTDMYALLGVEVSIAREKCALLALRALKAALGQQDHATIA